MKFFVAFFVIGLVLIFSQPNQALSQTIPDDSSKESLSPELRVWRNFSSDVLDVDVIEGWTGNATHSVHYVFDKLILGEKPEDQSAGERALRFGAAAVPLLLVERGISGASHEYGHFRVYSMIGSHDFEFVNKKDQNDRFDADPFNSFFTILKKTLGGKQYSATASFDQSASYYRDYFRHYREFDVMAEAGGLNQQQYNLEKLSDNILDGRAHPLDSVTYLINLIGTVRYSTDFSGSDITDYIDDLRLLGVKTDVNKVKWVSQAPKVFSNSGLSVFLGAVDYWQTGNRKIEPLTMEVGEVRAYWPEFASYLTLYGPTVKVSQRNDWKGNSFTVSLERSLSDGQLETGIGWKGPIISNVLSAEARLVHNFNEGGTWIEGGPTLQLFSWLTIGVKGYSGNGYTFRREIAGQVPDFVESQESGLKGFIQVNIQF